MANLTNNRVNTIATAAQITAAKTALQTVTTNLPFLIGLTKDERASLTGINVANKTFTEDAISAGINNPSILPSFLSVANMQNDLTLFSQLDEIIILTKQFLEKLEDTQLLVGSEAYSAALIIYKQFGIAADSGIAGTDTIVAQLGERFASHSGSTATPSEPK